MPAVFDDNTMVVSEDNLEASKNRLLSITGGGEVALLLLNLSQN